MANKAHYLTILEGVLERRPLDVTGAVHAILGEKLAAAIEEASDNLQELSKKTLGSYAHKAISQGAAASSVSAAAGRGGDEDASRKYGKIASKRINGALKATKKLAKEDYEIVMESLLDEAQVLGIELDEEELVELSKETLNSYAAKAETKAKKLNHTSDSLGGRRFGAALRRDQKHHDALEKAQNKVDGKVQKTYKGIDLAKKKLTKEEVELDEADLQELSKDTLKKYLAHSVTSERRPTKTSASYISRGRAERSAIKKASVKEETDLSEEDLQELSRKTLANYADRAMNDVRNANLAVGRREKNSHTMMGDRTLKGDEAKHDTDQRRIAKNREKGVKTAITKLSK